MAYVDSVKLSFQWNSTNTVVCEWTCSLSNVDHYDILWKYATGQGDGFDGGTHTFDPSQSGTLGYLLNDTYDYPSNATHVRAWVRPISKTRTVNGVETSYWTGNWKVCEEDYWIKNSPPEVPDTPTVEIGGDQNSSSKYKLTMTLSDIRDSLTDYVEFYIRKNGTSKVTSVYAKKGGSYNCIAYYYVSPGATYAVAARAINNLSSGTKSTITLVDGTSVTLYNPQKSDWSPYSAEYSPPPDVPTNPACSAYDKDIVKVTWTKATGATGYEVQYAKNKSYLEKSSNDVQSQTVDNTNTTYITGLETGEEWFFRVRATNDTGESAWTSIVSTVIGSTPEAPTTWSSTTTAMIGDVVNLYWVHNCEDGSDQDAAEIQITPSIGSRTTIDIIDDTTSYALETESYSDGTEIAWQVRTKGIIDEFGPWSTVRTIKVNAPATLSIEMPEIVDSFPINIVTQAEPVSQKAISYYISVFSNGNYDAIGPNGETLVVSAGDEIYSKLYNTSYNTLSEVLFTLSVGDLTLQDGQTYTVKIIAAMDTGLTAETSAEFTVSWSAELHMPYAAVGIDNDNLVTYISPFCERVINFEEGDDPDEAERELVPDVTLAVYRREPDGTFTLIGDGIENNGIASITDPHPALDYARYRIVAENINTGQISFEDLPGIPINSEYMVIQWDENWVDFDYDGEEKMDDPVYSGSMIKIPYNIDVSEAHSPDNELVEYVGRSHPVSYYGTQLGETGSWSVDVPKDDEEMIYALRRLAIYMGDVYVREPSGTGYWAQIAVSMNTNHCEVVVPVSFTISRVEGGM